MEVRDTYIYTISFRYLWPCRQTILRSFLIRDTLVTTHQIINIRDLTRDPPKRKQKTHLSLTVYLPINLRKSRRRSSLKTVLLITKKLVINIVYFTLSDTLFLLKKKKSYKLNFYVKIPGDTWSPPLN